MVLYGLLDPDDSVHYVRVNRAYLREGEDALRIAREDPEATNYPAEALEVELIQVTGSTRVTVSTLSRMVATEKDSGAFYYPDQVLYVTPQAVALRTDEGTRYEVAVRNLISGHEASAETDLVAPFAVQRPLYIPGNNTSFGAVAIDREVEVALTPSANSTIHQLTRITVHYTERYFSGDSARRVLKVPALFTLTGGSEEVNRLLPEGFILDAIGTTLDVSNNTQVRERVFGPVDFTFYAGNQALSDYIEINDNFSPLSQTKPLYTNVQNGVGLLASRRRQTVSPAISANSLQVLQNRYPDVKVAL
ncbi:hypothetical protein SAMN05421823_102465 [Catalinimonas alkaloidigena]|uniref:Uncharacterized protein n=2 Tax=Catalinimonas alkaloidigena TaxID=1075417 RepID=A0A1G9B019_9BACT|nr:hypothetical protein SAMN05421823_102465 [Catalinimonas alkaloidigena]